MGHSSTRATLIYLSTCSPPERDESCVVRRSVMATADRSVPGLMKPANGPGGSERLARVLPRDSSLWIEQ
jgi:hypothetical protein